MKTILITAITLAVMQCTMNANSGPKIINVCTYEDQFGVQTVDESRWKCEQRKCINKESNVTPFMNSDFDFTFAYESRCVEYARLVSATQIQIPEVSQ